MARVLLLVRPRFALVLTLVPALGRVPEFVLAPMLRSRLGDLSLNLAVAISERDVLAQNEQAERYDGRSMNVHDRRLHQNALLVCSAGVDARAVSSDRNYQPKYHAHNRTRARAVGPPSTNFPIFIIRVFQQNTVIVRQHC